MALNACLNIPAPGCVKPPLSASAKCMISNLLLPSDEASAMAAVGECDPNRYIVAFCGSGTGHLTQAMKVVEMLNERGMVLAGVVTDSDAPEVMLNELITPLGVPLLVIPAIELVDTQKGFIPLINPCRFISSIANSQKYMINERTKVADFFHNARAGKIFNMFHLTLARYFQLNPLPPQMEIIHMAAQFGLGALQHEDTRSFTEVATKAISDVMANIFRASGPTIPIGPRDNRIATWQLPNTLPPIIHIPPQLKPGSKGLILCYFLVQTNAVTLDQILLEQPMPNTEFHCFTSVALEHTQSQLKSHKKQRALFQELFSRCTGVVVSAGNETVWEAVCRGVPVLTIPTEGHGEQMLNATLHARNFPELVQQRSRLLKEDIAWLAKINPFSEAAMAESAALRAKVTELQANGSPLLAGETSTEGGGAAGSVASGADSPRKLANQLAASAVAQGIEIAEGQKPVEEMI